jgi:hypothetical protein
MIIIVVGILLIALGIGTSLYFIFGYDWANADTSDVYISILVEFYKFSLAVILVGGAVLLYKYYTDRVVERKERVEREREDREVLRRRLDEFFRDLTRTYNRVKFLRRELKRALSDLPAHRHTIDEARYVELMRELNIVQLELEEHRQLAETRPAFLTGIPGCGVRELQSCEDYLRQVTKEYEEHGLPDADGGRLVVEAGSRLFQFTASRTHPDHDCSAADRFFGPLNALYGQVAGELSED